MKVNGTKFNMIKEAIHAISNEIGIDIVQMNGDIFDVRGVNAAEFGINWSCMGTQPIKAAREYADCIYDAIEIARFLNECEFYVDYTNTFKFDDNNRHEWLSKMGNLRDAIRKGKLDVIWDFVEYVDVNGNC